MIDFETKLDDIGSRPSDAPANPAEIEKPKDVDTSSDTKDIPQESKDIEGREKHYEWVTVNTSSDCGCNNACYNSCYNAGH